MNLFALHGFLGAPSDWDHLKLSFPFSNVHSFNLFDPMAFDPTKGLEAAGIAINDYASESSGTRIIIGYSLGGRLALHALIHNPQIWTAAVIISAHPGLTSEEEKGIRYQGDQEWAGSFLSESWNVLVDKWNSQPIFKENYGPKEENLFSRQSLATALTGWSLGIQKDLTSTIADLNLPILWMTGESDQKFTSIGKHLKFSHSLSKQCVIKDAAHRVPWDNSSEFLDEMCDYLSRITKKEIQ